jgi:bacteriorhodopsin
MSLLTRSNDALGVNPPVGNRHLTTHGSDWLWAVCAIYTFSFLVVVGLTLVARQGERIFHYLFTISLFTGAIAYFAMASDLGAVAIHISDNLSSPGFREIFYARYINWYASLSSSSCIEFPMLNIDCLPRFVGWTPLIIALGLISGVSWATIAFNVALSWTWVASWLSGSMTATNYKWGFFAYGTFAYFLLAASFLHTGLLTAKRLGIQRHYVMLAGWTVFLWLLYPIAYGLDDGGNKITVTDGFVFFGILDVLLVPALAFGIIVLSSRWDYRSLNLYFTQYGRVAQGADLVEREKAAPVAAEPAVVDTV